MPGDSSRPIEGLPQASIDPAYPVYTWEIAAVFSPLNTTQISPTEDNLWQHEAVVEALMTDRTVLPVRFGTVLADEAAIQAVLEAHYADFVFRT